MLMEGGVFVYIRDELVVVFSRSARGGVGEGSGGSQVPE
jgi:hypothetical protein